MGDRDFSPKAIAPSLEQSSNSPPVPEIQKTDRVQLHDTIVREIARNTSASRTTVSTALLYSTRYRMTKSGIEIKIPNFGELHIKTICSDYTGTLSIGGKLIGGIRKRLRKLAESVDIHVVTTDTNNTSENELKDLPLTRHRIKTDIKPHHIYKRDYILEQGFDPKHVAVFGNGRNDRCWLKLVREADGLAVAVDVGEGCAVETINNANLFISGIDNALDLLLCPNRVKATLRS